MLIAAIFHGIVQGHEFDTFLSGMVYFLGACGHFFETSAVDNNGAFGAHAQGCAHRVHGRIAAADDCYGVSVSYGGGISGTTGSHEIDAREVFVGGHDADEVLAGYAHEARQSGAAGHKESDEALSLEVVVA